MKLKEKVNFSKFFPNEQQFVVVKGTASSPTDFNIWVDIGDGNRKTSFNIDPWTNAKDPAVMLKTVREAMQQALEFYEKALNLPAIDNKNRQDLWQDLFGDLDEKPAAKKPVAKKKKAAAKK